MNKLNLSFENLPLAVGGLYEKLACIEQLLLQKSSDLKLKPEQFLTIQEAAKFLNLSVPTIYSKARNGGLPVMKRGKRLYFSREELIAYLKEGKRKSDVEIEAEAEKYIQNGKPSNNIQNNRL